MLCYILIEEIGDPAISYLQPQELSVVRHI